MFLFLFFSSRQKARAHSHAQKATLFSAANAKSKAVDNNKLGREVRENKRVAG